MGIDPGYVRKALAELSRLTQFLHAQSGLDGQLLEQDFGLRLAVLHALQLAIQITLDVGAHLLASTATGAIDEYAEIGPRLVTAGVIPEELGSSLVPMARFRNLLVHQYAEIDLNRVALLLQTRLDDFRTFASAVVTYVDARSA